MLASISGLLYDELYVFSGLLTSQREVAMISEMIHTASLVHDDVIDQSDFRRGKPSVNKVWNHKKVRAAELFIYRRTFALLYFH